jgi:hypothetical protein
MTSFSLKTRVKPDGTLQLVVSTGLPESDVEVLLVIRPINVDSGESVNCWPDEFFEHTYGCLAEDPLVRPPQLPQETREKLL